LKDYLRVGVLTSTHGIKGEMNVFPTTDDLERYKSLDRVFLDMNSGKGSLDIKRATDDNKNLKELHVEGVKFFKGMAILKFTGIDRIEDVEKYKGMDLLVAREDAVSLAEGEHFIGDIIGLDVYGEDGAKLGKASDMLETAANNVLVVKTEAKKEILIPYVPEFIKDVDTENNRMTVHIIPGMDE
jgi:16S rRNA processing protein RimM